jgi:predicted nucleic acid-binding protein
VGKCYLNETDSAAVRELAGSANNINSSSLCIAELACALHRKVREGSLEQKAATKLADFFLDELLTRSLPKSTPIRAANAIHILSAVEAGFHEIWTNDRHLLAATAHFGLKGRRVG